MPTLTGIISRRANHVAAPPTPAARAYQGVVTADGAIGYWTVGDTVGSGAAAAIVGPALVATSVTFGIAGAITNDPDTAAGFNGDLVAGSSLAVSDPADGVLGTLGAGYNFSGTQPFSLEVWVDPVALVNNAGRLFRRLDAAGNYGYRLWIDTTSVSFMRMTPAGNVTAAMASPLNVGGTVGPALARAWGFPFPLGSVPLGSVGSAVGWYHIVATYTGTTSSLYVNAALQVSKTDTNSIPAATGTFNIGGGPTGTVNATLDEPAVYPAALTQTQVTNHAKYGQISVPSSGGGGGGGGGTIPLGTSIYARLPTTTGLGGTYYVDPIAGDDTRSALTAKSRTTPWRTINHAVDNVPLSGSIIVVIGSGVTVASSSLNGYFWWQHKGDVLDPVTIQAETTRGITIVGTGSSGAQVRGFLSGGYAAESCGLRVDGFVFAVTGQMSTGAHCAKLSHDIEFYRCDMIGNGGMGATTSASSSTTQTDRIDYYSCRISNNVLQPSNSAYGGSAGHGMYCGQGDNTIAGSYCKRHVWANCLFYGSEPGAHLQGGNCLHDSLVVNCVFYNNLGNPTGGYASSTYAGDAVLFYFDGSAVASGNATLNNSVVNCIMQGNRGHAVRASAGATRNEFTVWSCDGYQNSDLTDPGGGDFKTTYGTYTVGTDGQNLLASNPMMTNPAGGVFTLQAGSPAIASGDPAYTPTVDYDGAARVNADMGAYKF